jgi:hypothetical protein
VYDYVISPYRDRKVTIGGYFMVTDVMKFMGYNIVPRPTRLRRSNSASGAI